MCLEHLKKNSNKTLELYYIWKPSNLAMSNVEVKCHKLVKATNKISNIFIRRHKTLFRGKRIFIVDVTFGCRLRHSHVVNYF